MNTVGIANVMNVDEDANLFVGVVIVGMITTGSVQSVNVVMSDIEGIETDVKWGRIIGHNLAASIIPINIQIKK